MNSRIARVEAVALAHRRFMLDGVGLDPLEAFDVSHECGHGNIPALPGDCGCFTGAASPMDKLAELQAAAEVRTERLGETFRPASPPQKSKPAKRRQRRQPAKEPSFSTEELLRQIREQGARLCDRVVATGAADPGQVQEIRRLAAAERRLTRS